MNESIGDQVLSENLPLNGETDFSSASTGIYGKLTGEIYYMQNRPSTCTLKNVSLDSIIEN